MGGPWAGFPNGLLLPPTHTTTITATTPGVWAAIWTVGRGPVSPTDSSYPLHTPPPSPPPPRVCGRPSFVMVVAGGYRDGFYARGHAVSTVQQTLPHFICAPHRMMASHPTQFFREVGSLPTPFSRLPHSYSTGQTRSLSYGPLPSPVLVSRCRKRRQ